MKQFVVYVGILSVLMLALWIGDVISVDASTFQSPLATPTAQPDPPPDTDPGDGDGGLEFPDVPFSATIVAIIMGLVQYSKELGVRGKGSLTVSIVLGLVLGGGDFLASNGNPSDFAGWFGVLVVGLAYGLSTSGLYLLSENHRPRVSS